MRPKIIAHRGASHLAPENTVAAFRLAAAMGVDGIEFDTLFTADGHLVVHHEYITDLHANANEVIPWRTLDELRALDFGSWKDPRWAGEKIPTFAEALEACSTVDTIQVEFKSPLGANATTDQDAFAERILEEVESSGLADKIIITSFNHGILSRVKKLAPQQRVGVLTLNSVDSYLAPPPALLQALGIIDGPEAAALLENGMENGLPPAAVPALRQLVDMAQYVTLNGDETSPLRWVIDRLWALTSDHPGENPLELLFCMASQHDLPSYLAGLDFVPEVLSCQYNTCFRDLDLVQKVQATGVEVAPWPVDGVFDLKSILAMDPVTVVTNRPERLFQMLDPDWTMPEAAAAMLASPSAARVGGYAEGI